MCDVLSLAAGCWAREWGHTSTARAWGGARDRYCYKHSTVLTQTCGDLGLPVSADTLMHPFTLVTQACWYLSVHSGTWLKKNVVFFRGVRLLNQSKCPRLPAIAILRWTLPLPLPGEKPVECVIWIRLSTKKLNLDLNYPGSRQLNWFMMIIYYFL